MEELDRLPVTFLVGDGLKASGHVVEPLVVETLLGEDNPDIGDHKYDILGGNPTPTILYLLVEQIEPIVLIPPTALLLAHQHPQQPLILILIEILNRIDRELRHKLDPVGLVDEGLQLVLDVGVDVVEQLGADEL